MKLTHLQMQSFIQDGYVQVPGVVPQIMVSQALKAINHSLGAGLDKSDIAQLSSRSFCPELTTEPVITDLLLKTPAWNLAQSLVGQDKIKEIINHGQIALRFPMNSDKPLDPSPHLDGMYTKLNGVKEGTIQNFTMLVGVLLSDLTEVNAGNFTVWPGTHLQYERYFQEHGPEALLNGMPPIDMPEPKQILGNAGDVVLCHYQLAHTAVPNISSNIRYAIFFRMEHVDLDHSTNWQAPMKDIWLHWEGVRAFMA